MNKKNLEDVCPRFHHIGWAVHSIDAALESFAVLGYVHHADSVVDASRNVRICILESASGPCIELVEPLNVLSPISALLEKNGPQPYHICLSLSSSDFEAFRGKLRKNGFLEIIPRQEAPALDGRDVVFFYSTHLGLIELVLEKCEVGAVELDAICGRDSRNS